MTCTKCEDMSDGPEYAEVARRVEAVRLGFSDLNKKAWAEKHNFKQTQYQHWSKGTRRINVDDAQKLCDLYGLSLDFIYRGKLDGLSDNARKVLLSHLPAA